jgi:Predicted integral membrane protein
MNATKMALASALTGLMTVSVIGASFAQSGPAPQPSYKFEKCYGVVKAAKNDCQHAGSSCAGSAKRDHEGDTWIYLPAGSCDKIVGGSTEPKKS